MFDFSPSAILLAQPWLAPLYVAWLAFAPAAWTLAGIGAALVAASLLGAAWVPGFIRRPALWGGVAAIVIGLGWQVVQAEAVRRTERASHELSLAAERLRTEQAEQITRDIAGQAVKDLDAEHRANAKLKELLRDAQTRQGADRPLLSRDDARRLRGL